MSWLLHMSDPHLGDVGGDQDLDDGKVGFDQPDLETTQTVFRRTLRNLESFVSAHGKPAVVVISGDIAYRAGPSGFHAFVELMEECETRGLLPERDKVVVVPGNHDVVWTRPAGVPSRYRAFLGATREHVRDAAPGRRGLQRGRRDGRVLRAAATGRM